MLWSVIKIVVFIALIAGATLGAGYLLELDGGVRIVMAGQEFNLTPLKAVIALILLVLALWLFLKLSSLVIAILKFINGDETALSRYFDKTRQEKGYRALADSMLALASGEGNEAMAKAGKAEKYLRKPALTNLITAQAAEMAGDRRKAEEVYKRLLKNDKTRFVGVRGILNQRLHDGDDKTALKLAKTAFSLKPKHEKIQDTLLQLQAKAEDWAGARQTLSTKLRYGSLPRDVYKRRDAVLALSEAREVLDEGNDIKAREEAIEANRLSPDLIPAAALAARGYLEKGSKRNATRVLRKAWQARPHPDLAAAFALIEPDETPKERLKRFAKLLKLHPEDRESKLLEAELQITAEDFPAARRALGDLVEHDPDARALTIMAAIERGEGGSDAVVRGWLARALSAPRGPQWVCENCQHIHAQWVPACENCRAFDTLSWISPPSPTITAPTGVAMLPLIVGALENDIDAAPREDDTEVTPLEDGVQDAEIMEDGPSSDKKAINIASTSYEAGT